MLRYDRQLALVSRLVRHSARKRIGSILITPEPTNSILHRTGLYTADRSVSVPMTLTNP